VLDDIGLSILPGDRIGILGSNGEGKSTLMKYIAGSLTGSGRTAGEYLKVGYFAQHQLEQLHYQDSPFEHVKKLMPNSNEQAIRDHLGSFGFHGDAVFDTLEYRSGGEKARLALASLTAEKPNLLILDEPTNHLDLEARQTLASALQQYQGAVILVSHDRMMLSACCEQFLLVNNGRVSVYEDSLDDYIQAIHQAGYDRQDSDARSSGDKKNRRQQRAAQRALLKPLTNKVRRLEQELEKLNQQLQQLNQQLTDPDIYQPEQKQQLLTLQKKTTELKKTIPEIEEDWLIASAELEELNTINPASF